MGVDGQRHAPAALPPGKTRYPLTHCIGGWVGPRTGQNGCGKSPPSTGIRSPHRPLENIRNIISRIYILYTPLHFNPYSDCDLILENASERDCRLSPASKMMARLEYFWHEADIRESMAFCRQRKEKRVPHKMNACTLATNLRETVVIAVE